MSATPSQGSAEQGRDGEGRVLLDRLQELLERQLALVHQGRVAAAVALFEQTDPCVRRIAGDGVPVGPDSARKWQDVEQLYRELSLALTAQRAEVLAALKAIRCGKRALRAYSSAACFRR